MLREKLCRYLEEFGLNQHEARAYVALVAKGVATASEVSDISGIPYTRVYDALNSLESKGLVFRTPGRPMKFKAVHPSIALRNLRRKITYDFKRKLKELEEKEQEIVRELGELYEQVAGRVSESIQLLKGRVGIHGVISSLLRQAEKDILIVSTPTTLKRLLMANSDDFRRALDAGASVKAFTWGAFEEAPEWLTVKQLDKGEGMSPLNVLVVGNNTLFFEAIPDDLSLDSEYDTGLLVVSEKLANTVRLMASFMER